MLVGFLMPIKKKKFEKKVFFGIMTFCLIAVTPLTLTDSDNLEPFFTIDLLAVNNYHNFLIFNYTAEELAKIGIGVDTRNLANWEFILNRIWRYPGPFPVPIFDEGGYDVFIISWQTDLDWDLVDFFSSTSILPNGNNIYQYANPVMDQAIGNFTAALTFNDRLFWAKEIQSILYEDLPQITLFYYSKLYLHNAALEGWDGVNWLLESQPMENWSIPLQTTFHYATAHNFEDFLIYLCENSFDSKWLHQIYNGLVSRNPLLNNAYAPRLASSYSTVDGLTYHIQLNPNVKWADGVTFNASDVEFSYKLMITPTFNNPNYDYWVKYLTNDSITINSEFDLAITFNQSCLFQEKNLELPIIPKHIWQNVPPADFAQQAKEWAVNDSSKIIGVGPYMLAEYNDGANFIHLTTNPYFKDWFGTDPKFNDIYFDYYKKLETALSALASGIIDMIDADFYISPYEIPPNTAVTTVCSDAYKEIAINNYHPYIGTGENCPIAGKQSAKYVRRAINHIIPREMIENAIANFAHENGITPCPPSSPFFDRSLQPFNYSLAKAKHFMELAGFQFPQQPSYVISIGFQILPILVLFSATIIIARLQRIWFEKH